ncbi:protein DBF4 homolog B [Oryzias melastigma]|uniref:protein DBF4 homolog B n=1 Tax=Oryzias melastigma TaxID=30732 RepID=UPI000CF80794|nr:protein DBF4 homolog B [Oryzias melastigma]
MQPQQFSKERGLFGKLSPGMRKLEGKTFYLDNVKRLSTALLLEAVSLLGGKIESFLHKDVSFVVTGSQERLKEKNGIETREEASKGTQLLTREQKNGLNNDKLPTKPSKSMACASRGKALLEKAIRNNERLRGSSVLSDARSWGVKILYVDDVLVCLKQLTRESFSPKHKRIESGGAKEGGGEALRGAAAEDGGPGDRPRGEQADRSGNLQAQLSGPADICGLV